MIVRTSPLRRDDLSVPEASSEKKRKRKAISCYDCRRRKLKCDRELPACSRCRKAGVPESCSYQAESPPPSAPPQSGPSSSSGAIPARDADGQPLQAPGRGLGRGLGMTRIGEKRPARTLPQSDRIAQLESRLASLEAGRSSATFSSLDHDGTDPKLRAEKRSSPRDEPAGGELSTSVLKLSTKELETMIFRGEHFATQYHGSTNPTSLVAHFPELRVYMKEAIMQHSSLPRVQRELKVLQERWKVEKVAYPSDSFKLLDLLPAKGIVDELVNAYIDTYESLYRVLHIPSFREEYQDLWVHTHSARPAFIITVLLMIAAVNCGSLRERPTYVGDSSVAREEAVLWIEVSEDWLRKQSQKHVYLAIWQIRCLLVIAKQANTVKKKQTWTMTGTMIREAMSAGFHRDPALLGAKVSVFHQEIRRRLWATMVELDLGTSIERGMPSAIPVRSGDTTAVLNIDDVEISEGTTDNPTEKPKDVYTDASFLHLCGRSLQFRNSLNTYFNELSSSPLYDEVLSFDDKIRHHLQEIPYYDDPSIGGDGAKFRLLPQALLEIQLRQYSILLHGLYAKRADAHPQFSFSRMACFDAASKILDTYSKLDAHGITTLSVFRNDVFRVAMAICHTVYVSSALRSDIFVQSLNNTFLQYIEKALRMLEDKIARLGTCYTHYWYISAAYGLIQSGISPGEVAAQKLQAIDRVARQYYKVLAAQEDMQNAKAKILISRAHKPTTGRSSADNLSGYTGSTLLGAEAFQPDPQQQLAPNLEEFYFGDPSAWTFENLWPFEQTDLGNMQF